MEIIIASNNQNKIKEIKTIVKESKLLSLKDIGFDKEIDETGTTFEQNAYIKAKTIYDIYKKPVISDDSGLCVDALDGKPGVYSHRFFKEDATDEENNLYLVSLMKGKENRNCHYTSVICFILDENHVYYAKGTVDGIVMDERKGTNGFGYDPYIFIPLVNKYMAELNLDEKNKISHRANALKKLKDIIYENNINL